MNEKALLLGVLDAPDDDAPRLVYADWLEEAGQQERAELIRGQIALERLAPHDAGHARLAARATALLRRHWLEWRPPLPAWVDTVWEEWRRGFLDQVGAAARHYARKGEALCRLAPLRAVRLEPVLRSLPLLAGSPRLGLLPEVTLADGLRDRHVEALAASPHLARVRCLRLTSSRVRDGALVALAGSPHVAALKGLIIDGDWAPPRQLTVTGLGALGRSANLPALRSLRLERCRIHGEPAEALFGSPLFARLRHLDLSANRLGTVAVGALARAPATGLRSLRLGSCGLGDAGVAALASSPHLAGLVALDLTNNRIGTEGALALARSPYMTGLRSLVLSRNSLGDEAIQHLASASGLGALTALDLGEQDSQRQGLTLAGLEALLASRLAGRLIRLDLSRNALGDEGARRLAGADRLAALEWLGVGEMGLSPRGLRALLDSPHLAGLAAMRWEQERFLPSHSPLVKRLRQRMGHEDD